jgi:hypothetical protein
VLHHQQFLMFDTAHDSSMAYLIQRFTQTGPSITVSFWQPVNPSIIMKQ